MYSRCQTQLADHFMIGNFGVDTLLFANDKAILPNCESSLEMAVRSTLITSNLQGFWFTGLHIEYQGDGFSWS